MNAYSPLESADAAEISPPVSVGTPAFSRRKQHVDRPSSTKAVLYVYREENREHRGPAVRWRGNFLKSGTARAVERLFVGSAAG